MDPTRAQRRHALAARRQLTRHARRLAACAACRRLARLPAVRRARTIGLYHPLASEIDPRPLVRSLGDAARTFFYPRVRGQTLGFVADDHRCRWRRSALGVLEPSGPARSVSALDVLILPLAAFDARGHRIGLGGGFYDRTLAAVRDRPARGPHCIGVAFDCQRIARIEPRAWDVPLSTVVTERATYRRATSA